MYFLILSRMISVWQLIFSTMPDSICYFRFGLQPSLWSKCYRESINEIYDNFDSLRRHGKYCYYLKKSMLCTWAIGVWTSQLTSKEIWLGHRVFQEFFLFGEVLLWHNLVWGEAQLQLVTQFVKERTFVRYMGARRIGEFARDVHDDFSLSGSTG